MVFIACRAAAEAAMVRLRGQKQTILTDICTSFRDAKLLNKSRLEFNYSEEGFMTVSAQLKHGDATCEPLLKCSGSRALADFVWARDLSRWLWKNGIGMCHLDSNDHCMTHCNHIEHMCNICKKLRNHLQAVRACLLPKQGQLAEGNQPTRHVLQRKSASKRVQNLAC